LLLEPGKQTDDSEGNEGDRGHISFSTYTSGSNPTSTERVRITPDGNVGVSTASPNYRLHVATSSDGAVAGFTDTNGTCTINPTNTSLSCSSDRTLKKDIQSITTNTDILNSLGKLQPITYRWNGQSGSADKQYGFVAQDVEKVFPELVSTGPDDKKKLSYSSFIPVNTAAINELNQQVDKIDANQNSDFWQDSPATDSASSSTSSTDDTDGRSVTANFRKAVANALGAVVESGKIVFEKLTADTIVVRNTVRANRGEFKKEVEAIELCAGDTCVNEKELEKLLKEVNDKNEDALLDSEEEGGADGPEGAEDGTGDENDKGDTKTGSNQDDSTAGSSTASTTNSEQQDSDNNQQGETKGENSDEQPNEGGSEEDEQDADEDEPKNGNATEDSEKKDSDESKDLETEESDADHGDSDDGEDSSGE
jgi:hypothetical protein